MKSSASASRDVGPLVDHLFREFAGRMVAALVRVFGPQHIDLAEDVVQDALSQALRTWPFDGVPANPQAWLLRVARNRGLDALRRHARLAPLAEQVAAITFTSGDDVVADDQLKLMLLCCHPALSRDSSVVLTLKTAAGFSVDEIARAFLSDPAAVAQRIVRAKRTIRAEGMSYELPTGAELERRVDSALDVLYLVFNEGHTSQAGDALIRAELVDDALRLALLLAHNRHTARPRVHALCALLCLTAARLPARTDGEGRLVLLPDQDRTRWDARLIGMGFRELERAAQGAEVSRYHIEAEIAAAHAVARTGAETDWTRVAVLYNKLYELTSSPIVALNRAVAVGMAEGADPALAALASLAGQPLLTDYYPYHAVRAEFLARAGRAAEAGRAMRAALALHPPEPVRRHLQQKLAALRIS